MKTITIRDLRQKWPAAEAALQVEEEIIITRDGKPVAKLTRVTSAKRARKRWDASEHAQWQKSVGGGKVRGFADAALAEARAERPLISRKK